MYDRFSALASAARITVPEMMRRILREAREAEKKRTS
jgi:hypothetical protein